MLDKSLPYLNIIMKRNAGTPLHSYPVPQGFSLVHYAPPGDEAAWADILVSVAEFDTQEEALAYFQVHYAPHPAEVMKRCIFLEDHAGDKVATFTIWWDYKGQEPPPSLHWIAVKPQYQGLGKAIVSKGIDLALAIDGDRDIWLHTQTWSWRAVAVYLQVGFQLVAEGIFADYCNDYPLALPILKTKLNALRS
jgi:RimJ/RimL family protein N-acetyltransferase